MLSGTWRAVSGTQDLGAGMIHGVGEEEHAEGRNDSWMAFRADLQVLRKAAGKLATLRNIAAGSEIPLSTVGTMLNADINRPVSTDPARLEPLVTFLLSLVPADHSGVEPWRDQKTWFRRWYNLHETANPGGKQAPPTGTGCNSLRRG